MGWPHPFSQPQIGIGVVHAVDSFRPRGTVFLISIRRLLIVYHPFQRNSGTNLSPLPKSQWLLKETEASSLPNFMQRSWLHENRAQNNRSSSTLPIFHGRIPFQCGSAGRQLIIDQGSGGLRMRKASFVEVLSSGFWIKREIRSVVRLPASRPRCFSFVRRISRTRILSVSTQPKGSRHLR